MNTKYVVFFCADSDSMAMGFDDEEEANVVAEYLWKGIPRSKRDWATCQVITATADSLRYEDGTLTDWEELDSHELAADLFDDEFDGPDEHRWYKGA